MPKKLSKHFTPSAATEAIDFHFAKLMLEMSGGGENPLLFLAASMASRATREGNVCINLTEIIDRMLLEPAPLAVGDGGLLKAVDADELSRRLSELKVVGKPGEKRPLILDDKGRLYLYRYWQYEKNLAEIISQKADEAPEDFDAAHLKKLLDEFFPQSGKNGLAPDMQKVAAFTAVAKNLCIISGGPGTGKTTTVAKILALLVTLRRQQKLRVSLCAPTGKAAARLQEAVRNACDSMNCPDEIRSAMPDTASTVNRLLGYIPDSPYFRKNEKNPLADDLVIVDEASMMPLSLMSKLLRALKPGARLILLGDKDQLASVEAGSVMGDLWRAASAKGFSESFIKRCEETAGCCMGFETGGAGGLGDCAVHLTKSWRFKDGSGIGGLSRAVNEGNPAEALALLKTSSDIKWSDSPDPAGLKSFLRERIIDAHQGYLKEKEPDEKFRLFGEFRILSAVRSGPFGVENLNFLAERILIEEGLIAENAVWYDGRPVMILTNDYNLKLFNGDVGLTISEGNEQKIFFQITGGGYRTLSPARLPAHETVYAMTVHKSQGSEFNSVLLILPPEDNPVMTRELIYTAITRARSVVEICARENIFSTAIERQTTRSSGLTDALEII